MSDHLETPKTLGLIASGLLLLTIGCGDSTPSPDGGSDAGMDATIDAGLDGGPADGGDPELAYLNTLGSFEDLARLEKPGEPGVKYLAQVDGAEPPSALPEVCYFQNMRRWSWHLQFLQKAFPDLALLDFQTYVAWVLKAPTRRLWGGDVRLWPGVTHPISQQTGIMTYTLYTEEVETLTAAQISEVDARLKSCMPFARDWLVFLPSSTAQQNAATSLRAELEGQGVGLVFPRDLVDGLESESYSLGTGYGYLRVVPQGTALSDYGPRDVVVVENAPNDISIVSGLITMSRQNPASHVNLRLSEKGVPNASVPAIYDNALLPVLAGKLVRLTVSADRVDLQPATLQDAEAYWAAHRPVVPPPTFDLSVTELASFDSIGADDAIAYGAKTANLAELHAVLPPEHRVEGFGIPFSEYARFMSDNGLDLVVAALVADPLVRTDATVKRARLKELRDQIRAAPLAADFESRLHAKLSEVFGPVATSTLPVRFRSSTNVEDLEDLTGAGLYDSRRGCLADDLDADVLGPSNCLDSEERAFLEGRLTMLQSELQQFPSRTWLSSIIADIEGDLANEKMVARALRRVWSSLWNERAWDEREFYGIDHGIAYMGVAVNPAFVLEELNAVAFTELPVQAGAPLYRVVSQLGYESVVRPADPTVVAEVLTFRREGQMVGDVQILVPSSLSPGGAPLWSSERLTTLATQLFTVQDHFAASVYPDQSPLSLDIEVKIDRRGQVRLKQARPYVTAQP